MLCCTEPTHTCTLSPSYAAGASPAATARTTAGASCTRTRTCWCWRSLPGAPAPSTYPTPSRWVSEATGREGLASGLDSLNNHTCQHPLLTTTTKKHIQALDVAASAQLGLELIRMNRLDTVTTGARCVGCVGVLSISLASRSSIDDVWPLPKQHHPFTNQPTHTTTQAS